MDLIKKKIEGPYNEANIEPSGVASNEEPASNDMGLTFGGDTGFFKMDKKIVDKSQNTRNHSPQKKRELDVIYETEH